MPVEAPEIIEVDDHPRRLRRRRRRAGPSPRLSGNGRREFRRMPLLRPALCAQGRRRTPLSIDRKPLKKGDHLYLIDGSGYLFRAYHALPPLTRKSDGLPTGAVSGYCNMLWKLLEDMKGGDRPTHLAVIFDAGEKTFRNEIYTEYKANRPPPPEDLIPQFPLVRDATRAFGVSCVEMEGYRGRRPDRHLCAAGARGRRARAPSSPPTRI